MGQICNWLEQTGLYTYFSHIETDMAVSELLDFWKFNEYVLHCMCVEERPQCFIEIVQNVHGQKFRINVAANKLGIWLLET